MKRKNEEESLLVTKKPNLQNSSSSEEFTIAAFLSTLKNSFEAYSGNIFVFYKVFVMPW